LLGGHGIGSLGDAVVTTALILHLQRTAGTATAVGLLLFAQALPPLAAPVAGTLADRVDAARLVVVCSLLQAAIVGLLALGPPSRGPLLALVVALAAVEGPLGAAVGRWIPALVGDHELPGANAVRGGVRELGAVLGPPLAGALVAVSGPRLALVAGMVAFLAAIPLVRGLPTPAGAGGVAPVQPFGADVRAGVGALWHDGAVRAMATGFWVVAFFSASDDLILPFLATDTFGAGPLAVGLLLGAAGLGLLLGLPLVRPVGDRLGATTAVVAAFAVMSAGNALTGVAPWLAAAFATQLVRGVALPVADTFVTTHVQRAVPPALVGRVLANAYGGVAVAAAAGYLVGGPLVDATSPRWAFVAVGLGGGVGAALTGVLLRRAGGGSPQSPGSEGR
jgi:MFS family permease